MNPTKPVKLRFFDNKTANKFSGLCTKLGIKHDGGVMDTMDIVTTEPLDNKTRRTLMSAWANASMEREG